MRFGIMTMQLESIIPMGIPAGQIIASLMSFSHAGLVKSLADKGFNPIELGGDLDLGRFLDRLEAANFSGPLVFELKVDEALESLEVIRSLRSQYL